MQYIAKANTWFDEGTEAEILVGPYGPDNDIGLFRGIKDGQVDEEVCLLEEFVLVVKQADTPL